MPFHGSKWTRICAKVLSQRTLFCVLTVSFVYSTSAFSGGLLGALFVTTSILLAPVLGFATFQLAVVTGQLVSGKFVLPWWL